MKHKTKFHYTLFFRLVVFVFIILSSSVMVIGSCWVVLVYSGIVSESISFPFVAILTASIIIGMGLTVVFSRKMLHPFHEFLKATKNIAAGDFSARINSNSVWEINQMAESFNTMAQELQNMEIMRSDFISNVSHEFKTPLMSIRGFAKLLKKDTLDREKRDEYLDIIIQEAARLSQLAGNILLLSKLEGQQILPDKEEFLLDEQIRRAVLILESAWKKKEITISSDLPATRFRGNEEILSQIWINLIGNAIKFSESGGTISLSLYQKNDDTVVRIADTGIGMNREVIKHIFDKFYQGDTSHNAEGNGLGLSLVKRIAEMHQGRISVESEEGRGTTVYVYLPATGQAANRQVFPGEA